ncbi:hypothetical protein Agub_g6045 [Astrephomene gubernaculifera]|uniref:Uncharacterized protein n=1 Tax=Astrephomene gubernaculifera TaxID=47775 RepID=A0AAD3HL86_9CHLO|nr:hypothetical protein Agub_g6045 [Astrephomene gubernaculifera]
MAGQLQLVVACTLAAASGLVLWILEQGHERRQENNAGRPGRYERGMREREYVRLIPDGEMLLVRSLLRRIYKSRGWTIDAASRERAWAGVLATAQTQAGGSWPMDFQPCDVTSEQLQALCLAVEQTFLGGLLSAQIRKSRRPRLQVELAVDPRDPHSWLSGLHEDNTIYINANRWRESISDVSPLDFEGTLCSSKLEALAHALGHELVHAVVLNFFPEMDATSPAYIPDDKHGPIFMLLNKRLFGHTGHACRRLFTVEG